MFERLDRVPDDPILGLMAAFRADPDPKKVDLGVGVFRDAKGDTPVLDCVRKAEQAVLERQTSKTYVAPAGNAAFNQAMEKLVFGADHPVFAAARVRSIQGPGRLRGPAPGRGAGASGRAAGHGACQHPHLGQPCAADDRYRD